MTDFDVVELDPDDDSSLFDGALALDHAEFSELDPTRDLRPASAFRADLHSNADFPMCHLFAVDGSTVVGRCSLHWWTVEGNTDKLDLRLYVRSDHRRRGAATALLRAALDKAASLNRTTVVVWAPLSTMTRAFFGSLDLEVGYTERESRLVLADTDAELMQQWIDQRHQRASEYQLVRWVGATPPEHLERVAELMTAMNDAPMDDIDYADDLWTPDDVRNLDDYLRARGREVRASIVIASDGAPAGLTVVSIPVHQPAFAVQGDTVVIGAHRNRGIGRWVKADMWQRLRAERPDVVAIDTENAESNDPMLAINVAMGFRPLLENAGWQAEIADLLDRIGTL